MTKWYSAKLSYFSCRWQHLVSQI